MPYLPINHCKNILIVLQLLGLLLIDGNTTTKTLTGVEQ